MDKTKKIKKVSDMDENQEQAVICSWCLQNDLIPVAVPNGFNLSGVARIMRANGLGLESLKTHNAIQMKMLKKEGLHTGFPDLMIFGLKGGKGSVLYLENKVKNNKPSEIQEACHTWLRGLGFTVEISKDSIDAIKKIKNFFGSFEQNPQYINVSYIEARKQILSAKQKSTI